MKENIKWQCVLCGNTTKEILYKEKRLPNKIISPKEVLCTGEIGARGKHGKIWICNKCKLIFQELSFSNQELEEAYSKGTDAKYFEQLKQREHLFSQSRQRIEKYIKPPGKLMDVGANAGIFLNVAQESGWTVEGIDPSKWAKGEAKRRFGVKVENLTFEELIAKPASFDVITMWDVLEHYLDPLAQLKKANKLLKKGGVLALTTININSWFSKLLGPHWPWIIRVHIWYFKRNNLIKMIKKAGFEIKWVGYQTRWFSLSYLLTRLSGKNFSWLPKISLPAPTNDIIFVIARKRKLMPYPSSLKNHGPKA